MSDNISQIATHEPCAWVRGWYRFGSYERRLQGYAFDHLTIKHIGVHWPMTVDEAMKVDEWAKKIGLVPKESELDAFSTLLSQDLVAFRWAHWEFSPVRGGDMISILYKALDELKELESKA